MTLPEKHSHLKEPMESHPHLKAQKAFESIAHDPKFTEEEREIARYHLFVINGIINLVSSITKAYPEVCYLQATDLVEQLLLDPMQEQS